MQPYSAGNWVLPPVNMCVVPGSLDPELELWIFVWSVSEEILQLSNIVHKQSSGRAWPLHRYKQGENNAIVSKVIFLVCMFFVMAAPSHNVVIFRSWKIWGKPFERESFVTQPPMHNMLFVQYVVLPTEQAELKIYVLIYHSTFTCPTLFGWMETMVFEETVIFKL